MGVSLETYRNRIGSFYTSAPKLKLNICKESSSNHKSASLKPLRLKLCLLLITGLTCFLRSPLQVRFPEFRTSTTLLGQTNHVIAQTFVHEDVNFEARYKYGNRRRQGIKICHWNKGGGYLTSKINEIENVISSYKPHIFGISEANYWKTQDIEDVKIENYEIYFAKSLENPNFEVSRVAAYVHKDLVVKVRNDLMNDQFSSIWLELGLRNQKKMLVCICYREWQYLKQPANDNSHTIKSQLERWLCFINQWEQAIATGREICVVGDFNLNYFHFDTENQGTNTHSYRLRSLIEALQNRIVPHGFIQLVSTATRSWPGQEPSCIDLLYSNHPEKLSEVKAHYCGGSDHKIVTTTRYTKAAISKPRIIKKRSYKNFDPQSFLEAVRNTSWWEIYSCEDCERAVELLTSKLTAILDVMAPIVTVQVRAKYAPWMSQNTKVKIKERDDAQLLASETNLDDDWRKYKTLRNNVTNTLRTEKKIWQSKKINRLNVTLNFK